jgi:hypothetical protein
MPQCPALSTTIPLGDLIPLIDHYDPNNSQNVSVSSSMSKDTGIDTKH